MLTYILDPQAKMPLYQQLYEAIRQDIISGRITNGEKLPSKRQLSAHLRVSPITIETAYGQLVAEGYLTPKPRCGYFAAALMPSLSPASAQLDLPAPPIAQPQSPILYDLRTNIVDTDCFPFSTWAKLLRSTLTEQSSTLLHATDPQGIPDLRNEICRYLYHFRGIVAEPSQVVVGAGSEYLVGLLIQLLGRDSLYALEDPGYSKLYQIFSAGGAHVCPIPLDAEGLRDDRLRALSPDVVYLTPSHHFPLGIVMPAGRRVSLLRWAESTPNRYLIEDDYDSEFRYASRPIPALSGLYHTDRVIYLNTFAKSIAPSLRIGYMVLPHPLAARFREQLGFYSSTVPSFEQITLAKFLKSGGFERHISRSRNLYKSRRDTLLRAIAASPLAPMLHVSGGDAGLHLLVHVENGKSEAALVALARENGVGVSGLSSHYHEARAPFSTILLGYAGIATQEIVPAVDALCRAWT